MLCHGDSIAYSSPMSCTRMGSLKTAPCLAIFIVVSTLGGHLILRDVFLSRDRTAPEWSTLFSVSLLLHTPRGRCYALDEILGWLRQAGFSRNKRPLPQQPAAFRSRFDINSAEALIASSTPGGRSRYTLNVIISAQIERSD